MKNTEIPYNEIAKYITGNCRPEETEIVDNWLNSDKQNRNIFNDMYDMWEKTRNQESVKTFDHKSALDKVNRKIDINSTKKSNNIRLSVWLRAAAILTAVFLLGYYAINKFSVNNSRIINIASAGEVKEITLPDGSKIWLNKNSTLKYTHQFNKSVRRVELNGESFFEVMSDPSRPFIIETNDSEVKVLGTSFNVRALDSEAQTKVLVETGLVEFKAKTGSENKLKLNPGEIGIINNKEGNTIKYKNTDPNITSWRTGILNFKNTPFFEAVNTIERVYDKHIEIKDNELAGEMFNGYFEKQPFNVILEVLKMNSNIEITDSSGIILISKR